MEAEHAKIEAMMGDYDSSALLDLTNNALDTLNNKLMGTMGGRRSADGRRLQASSRLRQPGQKRYDKHKKRGATSSKTSRDSHRRITNIDDDV